MSLDLSPNQPLVSLLPVSVAKIWLINDKILSYRFTNMERSTVDAVACDIQAEMKAWPRSKPLRLMLNMLKDNVVVSAYALHRARELTRIRPELTGKTALLTNNVLTSQITSLALRGIAGKQRQRLVFSNEAEAVAWLLQDDTIILP